MIVVFCKPEKISKDDYEPSIHFTVRTEFKPTVGDNFYIEGQLYTVRSLLWYVDENRQMTLRVNVE